MNCKIDTIKLALQEYDNYEYDVGLLKTAAESYQLRGVKQRNIKFKNMYNIVCNALSPLPECCKEFTQSNYHIVMDYLNSPDPSEAVLDQLLKITEEYIEK